MIVCLLIDLNKKNKRCQEFTWLLFFCLVHSVGKRCSDSFCSLHPDRGALLWILPRRQGGGRALDRPTTGSAHYAPHHRPARLQGVHHQEDNARNSGQIFNPTEITSYALVAIKLDFFLCRKHMRGQSYKSYLSATIKVYFFNYAVLGVCGIWRHPEPCSGRVDHDSQEEGPRRLHGRKDCQLHSQKQPEQSHWSDHEALLGRPADLGEKKP